MSPITHLLASWTAADIGGLRRRDLALATWCGLLPDADGLGLLVDLANRIIGRPNTWYYHEYHHAVLHGIFGALIIPLALCTFATNRIRMFILGFIAVHLHLFCDLIGSRGPGPQDIWPIPYLAPFSSTWTLRWAGQWPLDAWPNFAFTVALLIYTFGRAVRSGYSPVKLASNGADRVFVDTIRNRWRVVRRAASRSVSPVQ
jgi:inner membrane protein